MTRLTSFHYDLATVRIPASGRSGYRTGRLRSSSPGCSGKLAHRIRLVRTVAVRVFVIRRNDTVQYVDEHAAADLGFGGACIYLKLRYRRPSSLLRQYVGSGDLIFALLLTPLAPLPQYLLLLLGGCLAGLFYWLVVRVVVQKETTIPLVTFLSLPLTAYLSYRFYLSLP